MRFLSIITAALFAVLALAQVDQVRSAIRDLDESMQSLSRSIKEYDPKNKATLPQFALETTRVLQILNSTIDTITNAPRIPLIDRGGLVGPAQSVYSEVREILEALNAMGVQIIRYQGKPEVLLKAQRAQDVDRNRLKDALNMKVFFPFRKVKQRSLSMSDHLATGPASSPITPAFQELSSTTSKFRDVLKAYNVNDWSGLTSLIAKVDDLTARINNTTEVVKSAPAIASRDTKRYSDYTKHTMELMNATLDQLGSKAREIYRAERDIAIPMNNAVRAANVAYGRLSAALKEKLTG